MQTAVVILNWNGQQHLSTYLPSVVKHSEGATIIVADNGSTDQSHAVVQQFQKVKWLALDKNYGFAEGYNRALQKVKADIYVLLNSDVRVSPNWLQAPLLRFKNQREIAAIQPKILADQRPDEFEYAGACGGFLDSLGYPFCRGRIFDEIEKDEGQYNQAMQIDWASGACCFVRAEVWHKLGGLDGSYFAHMEEIDFCWRLRNLGYQCWVTPASTVYHLGGGTLNYASPRKTYLNFRNSLTTLTKNTSGTQVFFKVYMRLLLDGLAGVQFILKGNFKACWAIVRAHFAFYARLKGTLQKRKHIMANNKTAKPSSLLPNVKSIVYAYFIRGTKKFAMLFE